MKDFSSALSDAFAVCRGRYITAQEKMLILSSSSLTDLQKKILCDLYTAAPVLESWASVHYFDNAEKKGDESHWMYFPCVAVLLDALKIILPRLDGVHPGMVPFATDASGSGDFYAVKSSQAPFELVYLVYTDGVLSQHLQSMADDIVILAFDLSCPDIFIHVE